MRPEEILKLLRARPFRPFALSLANGAEYQVRHPELAMVDRSTVIVGLPTSEGTDAPLDDYVICALSNIVTAQPIDGAPASG